MKRALLALAACGGAPALTGDASGGDGPATNLSVAGSFAQHVVDNDASLHPETRAVSVPPADLSLAVELDDGTKLQPVLADDGLFSFPLAHPGQRYQLAVGGGGVVQVFDSAAASLSLSALSLGRTDRIPLTASTPITVVDDNYQSGDGVLLDSTGVWSQGGFTQTATTPPTFVLELDNDGVWFDGRPSQYDASENDREMIVAFRSTDTTSTGYLALVAATPLSLTTRSGMGTSVEVSLAPPPTACVHLVAPRGDEQQRYLQAQPSADYTLFTDAWLVLTPAGPGVGPAAGLGLANQSQGGSTAGATNVDQMIAFGNPFGASHVIAQMSEAFAYPIPKPGGGTATVTVQMSAFVDVPLASGCVDAIVPKLGAIPSIALLDGTPIAGGAIALDETAPVPVSWTLASLGAVDETIVQLVHLTSSGLQLEALITTAADSTTIDRSLLVDGESYLILLTSEAGNPHAADGDFSTTTFPFATASSASPVFQVTAK